MRIRKTATASVLALFTVTTVCAENWQPVVGAEVLRELISDATAEIDINEDVTATSEYYADGTAKVEAWGEVFERRWEIAGEDQVCYSAVTETTCYTLEKNLDTPDEYRLTNIESGEQIISRKIGKAPNVFENTSGVPEDGGMSAPTAQEVAAQLSDPNTNLGSMNTVFDYVAYDGDLPDAGSQNAVRATFQPSLPYKLSPTTNLFVRPIIPVILKQDVPNTGGGYDSKGVDLGDIGFDASVAKTLPSIGVVLGAGAVGTLPTATDDALGLDQWLLGPEVIGAVVRKWGVVGALVTHQWDVAGEDDYSTSITGGQYFYAVNLQDGWQINAAPVFSYNHKADSKNALTLPVGLGVSKTAFINGRPWKFGIQYWHYVESPDAFGPDFQIRINITPVVALPW